MRVEFQIRVFVLGYGKQIMPIEQDQLELEESIVDDDLVSIFDLLTKWDFEDNQREMSVLRTDPPTSSPEDQSLVQR